MYAPEITSDSRVSAHIYQLRIGAMHYTVTTNLNRPTFVGYVLVCQFFNVFYLRSHDYTGASDMDTKKIVDHHPC